MRAPTARFLLYSDASLKVQQSVISHQVRVNVFSQEGPSQESFLSPPSKKGLQCLPQTVNMLKNSL